MKRKYFKGMAAFLVATMASSIYTVKSVQALPNSENVVIDGKGKELSLVWEDNFEGESLNMDNWSYEPHEPGWVNNELQEYTTSTDNIYVEDGKLVLRAIEEEREDGSKYYTSGKVNTKNKQDYTYGRFEASVKVPEGKGLWPAFWMMPTDESFYGAWPRCGEIDIMEILGDNPSKTYGTIHYGNPHEEQQESYILSEGTFADDFHEFAVEWEPGEMRFYVDDILFHTVNDWFTKQDGQEEITFPAPFDQPFFVQFNLAVGGNWPGSPNETTNFENAKFEIDYVRVYQADAYDEDVEKPVTDFEEPGEGKNYIKNGDFSTNDIWVSNISNGGEGNITINDNKAVIKTTNQGTEDYSIQLFQGDIPLKKEGMYKITFDAKSSADREMLVAVSGPNRGWKRYFNDIPVELTTDVKTYEYVFTMNDKSDMNARLEFNCGNRGSVADIEISNVFITKIGEVAEGEKPVQADGNYISNGTFDIGDKRLKYWEIESNIEDYKVSVTNASNVRELKVEVNSESNSLSDLIVKQSNLAMRPNSGYVITFDAYSDKEKTIQVEIDGKTFDLQLTPEKEKYKVIFNTGDIINSSDFKLLVGVPGVTYIDNIRMAENESANNGLIINGDFSKDLYKWEMYIESGIASKVSHKIDNSTGNKALKVDIKDTSDSDWKIQLKQDNVQLQQGKKYKLSIDAKSTIERPIKFVIQRNGIVDNDWEGYSPEQIVYLDSEYNTYEVIFTMNSKTDASSIFNICMGKIGEFQSTEEHTVFIDNIKLQEIIVDELLSVITTAKELISSDRFNSIIEEDKEKLKAELAYAEKIYADAVSPENNTVSQEHIDKVVVNLRNIIDNLREIDDSDKDDEDEDNDEGNIDDDKDNGNTDDDEDNGNIDDDKDDDGNIDDDKNNGNTDDDKDDDTNKDQDKEQSGNVNNGSSEGNNSGNNNNTNDKDNNGSKLPETGSAMHIVLYFTAVCSIIVGILLVKVRKRKI